MLPNSVPLPVRTARRPLARAMGSLVAGYAGAFNRRHDRQGHLLQKHYKSIVVEEASFGLVPDLVGLAKSSGRILLLGHQKQPWQAAEAIREQFEATRASAPSRPPSGDGRPARGTKSWEARKETPEAT